jgi:hypothetical protein
VAAEVQGQAEEERRQLRPYRRFVIILFVVVLVALCAFVLRGIIRTLDRLPSISTFQKLDSVDERALLACADDLDKLNLRTRREAGRVFTEIPGPKSTADGWEPIGNKLEQERLQIVARCRLDEAGEDPVAQDLHRAADEMEEVLRSYSLLYARHKEDGLKHAVQAEEAYRRALQALRSR